MRRNVDKFNMGYNLGSYNAKLGKEKDINAFCEDMLEECETANERLSFINGFNHGYDEYVEEE